MAAWLRVSTLNSVDLPTFGRPTIATIGSIRSDAGIAVLAIARDARHVGDDGRVAAREHIEQCRFAYIRPTDDRDDRQHRPPPYWVGSTAAAAVAAMGSGARNALSAPLSVNTSTSPPATIGVLLTRFL